MAASDFPAALRIAGRAGIAPSIGSDDRDAVGAARGVRDQLARGGGGYYVAARLGLRFAARRQRRDAALAAHGRRGRGAPALRLPDLARDRGRPPSPSTSRSVRCRSRLRLHHARQHARSGRRLALLLVRVGFHTRLDGSGTRSRSCSSARSSAWRSARPSARLRSSSPTRSTPTTILRRGPRGGRATPWAAHRRAVPLVAAPADFSRGALGPRARGVGAVRHAVHRVLWSPCGIRSTSCSSCCHCSDGSRGDSNSAAQHPRRCSSPSSWSPPRPTTWGPFAGESLLSQMILLQTFNASVAFTTLLFASAVSERQQLVDTRTARPTRALPTRAPGRDHACSGACCPSDSRTRSVWTSRRGTSRRRATSHRRRLVRHHPVSDGASASSSVTSPATE